jgi:hypothetical protein
MLTAGAVQVCSARGLPEGTDAMVVVTLLPSVSAQSGETRVVYCNANPEWQQRFQVCVYDRQTDRQTDRQASLLLVAPLAV